MNYFRSIQKRFAIDMREFATRDRVMGDVEIVIPKEANKTINRNI
jgi:hypothetical protein